MGSYPRDQAAHNRGECKPCGCSAAQTAHSGGALGGGDGAVAASCCVKKVKKSSRATLHLYSLNSARNRIGITVSQHGNSKQYESDTCKS